MAVINRNKQDNNYLNYLTRVVNDGGTYERVPLYQYQDQYNKLMAYNPYMILFPSSKKNGVVYNILPNTGSMDNTFTRSSSGSYIDSNGLVQVVRNNEPRLQYIGSEFKGLLIEPSSTNLILRSEEFDDPYWTVFGTLNQRLANQTIAPNNTLTADLLEFPGTGQNLLRRTGITINNTSSYAISLYVKNNTFTQSVSTLGLVLNNNRLSPNSFSIRGVVNFQNESLSLFSTTNNGTGLSGSISGSLLKLSNGWYRIQVVGSTGTNASSSVSSFEIGTVNQTGSCFIWGAQLESSSIQYITPSSYIPTTTTISTRRFDNPQTPILNLGINSWSIFFEIEYESNPQQQSGDINGFSGGNYIWYFRRLNAISVNFWNQNNQQNLGSFLYAANSIRKFRGIITFDNNSGTINTYVNGTRCGIDVIPTSVQPYRNFLNASGSAVNFSKASLAGGFDSPHYLKQFAIYNYTLNPQSAQFLTTY